MMKQLVFIFLLLLTLTACSHDYSFSQRAVRDICELMLIQYPEANLQDVYKTCYQDFFGAEHMMQDTAAARQYLRFELDQMAREQKGKGMPFSEPTGFRHRFVRINLELVRNGTMTEEQLLQRFIDAAGNNNALHDHWEEEWAQIERIALEVHPAWKDEELQATLRLAAYNKQAVRHSENFRNKYKPHYRIIRL